MDVLSEILQTLHLKASVFLHACFRGEWAVDTSGQRRATFHLVASGGCWLHMPDSEEPIPLAGDDLIVFPHDARHTISNSQYPVADDFPRNQLPDDSTGGPGVTLICGYFDFDRDSWNPLIEALPAVMIIRNDGITSIPFSHSLRHLLIHEIEAAQMGSRLVIDKLSEVLFINTIRHHLKSDSDVGFLAALADKKIGKVLSRIHETPAHTWSVERLAQVAGMSRSAFSGRFTQLVGLSPMHYLSRWRMSRAHNLFQSGDQSVAQVAELSGYQSEAAFAKAFKKQFGYGPGAARKAARHTQLKAGS
ncbi:AraC family transcriptional regulator [Candidatus Thiodiazotropha sp. CDECU1]|uniref:AraC family transcriptional regulator n=1 Tax=Candidatus Thiodiazotropha sp. CDECU1 TaxID=3065865 RepID=UPI00292DF83D|nr:AraC family transcriptional regulator [Candidatus Thiodiazotropha sp. CDECU1]